MRNKKLNFAKTDARIQLLGLILLTTAGLAGIIGGLADIEGLTAGVFFYLILLFFFGIYQVLVSAFMGGIMTERNWRLKYLLAVGAYFGLWFVGAYFMELVDVGRLAEMIGIPYVAVLPLVMAFGFYLKSKRDVKALSIPEYV